MVILAIAAVAVGAAATAATVVTATAAVAVTATVTVTAAVAGTATAATVVAAKVAAAAAATGAAMVMRAGVGFVLAMMASTFNEPLKKNKIIVMIEEHIRATNRASENQEKNTEGAEESRMPTQKQLDEALKQLQYSLEKFHIALCGTTGSGKSSLINAFRGLSNNDPGLRSAPVKAAKCTLQRQRYTHPDVNNNSLSRFVWYDCPGAGVTNMPAKGYFNSQGLFLCDFIVLVWDNSFSELDIEILQNCIYFKVPFAVVRSKADQRIDNEMKSKNDSADPSDSSYATLRDEARFEIEKVSRENFQTEIRKLDSFMKCRYLEKAYVVSSGVIRKIVCQQQDLFRYWTADYDELSSEMPSTELPPQTQSYMIDDLSLVDDLFKTVVRERLESKLSRVLIDDSNALPNMTMAEIYQKFRDSVVNSAGTTSKG